MKDAPKKTNQWLIWLPLLSLFAATAWWLWPKPSITTPSDTHKAEQRVEPTVTPTDQAHTLDAPAATTAPPVPLDQLEQVIEQQGHISITGRPIDEASLRANQQRLLDELKGQKRPINPSTMSPLMALEYEQFGRYLERGDFALADQLLTDMQENWPEYDYEEMIYQLALAEVNADQ
ncbi:hypothetical protein [Marinicella meishanensis]|uniref:hypothetical protein n=1 Tax=Marinicella meishanensis TaxID=2873263 RepID=UPI001CC05857|nr:hypothetical protein [Marinicella sp. NBU2979]